MKTHGFVDLLVGIFFLVVICRFLGEDGERLNENMRIERSVMNETNLKTPDEIRGWLMERNWWVLFLSAVRNSDLSEREQDEILDGECGVNTITKGFDWEETKPGEKFWREKNREFLIWLVQ
mgnify:FL=1